MGPTTSSHSCSHFLLDVLCTPSLSLSSSLPSFGNPARVSCNCCANPWAEWKILPLILSFTNSSILEEQFQSEEGREKIMRGTNQAKFKAKTGRPDPNISTTFIGRSNPEELECRLIPRSAAPIFANCFQLNFGGEEGVLERTYRVILDNHQIPTKLFYIWHTSNLFLFSWLVLRNLLFLFLFL